MQKYENTIQLANGDANTSKLQSYFSGIFEAEKTGQEFAVNLEHVWRIGYARKDSAVRALRKNFVEGVDYQSSHNLVAREIGAVTEELFMLTVSCLEYFVVRSNREVFDIYRQCRQAVQNQFTQPALPGNYAEALRMLAEKVEQEEKLHAQLQIEVAKKEEAKKLTEKAIEIARQAEEETHQAKAIIEAQTPAVATLKDLIDSEDTVTLMEAAKQLNLPGIGRTNLVRMLQQKSILAKSDKLPYQHYMERGYFKVKRTIFDNEKTGKVHTSAVVLVTTGKGLAFLKKVLTK